MSTDDKPKLIPGGKYTHPNFTGGGKRPAYLFLVGEYPVKPFGCAVQIPLTGNRYDLSPQDMDLLVPYKEPVKYAKYFNIYEGGVGGAKNTRKDADAMSVWEASIGKRIGCKRVEFNEGEFDE